jgi:hypothetical protein
LELKKKKERILGAKEGKNQKIRDIYIGNCLDEVYVYSARVKSEWLVPSRKGDQAISSDPDLSAAK